MLILLPSWGRAARGGRASAVGAACGWEEVVEPSSLRYLQAKISVISRSGLGLHCMYMYSKYVIRIMGELDTCMLLMVGALQVVWRFVRRSWIRAHNASHTEYYYYHPFLLSPMPQVLQLHLFVLRDCTCRLACN